VLEHSATDDFELDFLYLMACEKGSSVRSNLLQVILCWTCMTLLACEREQSRCAGALSYGQFDLDFLYLMACEKGSSVRSNLLQVILCWTCMTLMACEKGSSVKEQFATLGLGHCDT
jgi:hypothetical protein